MAIHAATTTDIAFVGDSITAGWLDSGVPPNPNPSQRWQAGLEANITSAFQALGFSAPTYHNLGVGGQTTGGMLAELASIVATGAQHIFILSSVNDPNSSVPLLSPNPSTVSNYEGTVTGIHSSLPNTKIHIVSNIFWGGAEEISEKVPDSSNPHAAAVISLNDYIQRWSLAHKDYVEYLDVRADFLAWEIANNLSNVGSGLLTQVSATHLTATGQALASTGVWNRIAVTT